MHVLRYIQIWLYGLKWQTFRCPNTYPSNRETHGLQDDDGSARDLLAHGVMEFALSREVTSTAAHEARWQ